MVDSAHSDSCRRIWIAGVACALSGASVRCEATRSCGVLVRLTGWCLVRERSPLLWTICSTRFNTVTVSRE